MLLNLPGVSEENLGSTLRKINSELQEYVKDTGFILVVLDSVSPPVLSKNAKTKLKELKNVEEYVFYPGGNSNQYCSMLTNLPSVYAQIPLAQTSDRAKNRLQSLLSSSGSLSRHTYWARKSGRSQVTIGLIAAVLEEAEHQAAETRVTLQDFLGNGTIGHIVEQYNKKDNTYWLQANDFFFGDEGDFTTVREVSESSHDIIMGDSTSSDASAMDVDSLDASVPQAGTENMMSRRQLSQLNSQQQLLHLVPAAYVQDCFLEHKSQYLAAIEDAKSEEYYRASGQIRGAVDQLGEQLQQDVEAQQAEWVHFTEEYTNLWMSCEYATKACQRTGARVNMDGGEFNHHMDDPSPYWMTMP